MNRITVVCCYTNEKQLADFTESLDRQTESCDRIFINNKGNKFTSCSSAFNSVIKNIKTELVVFSHQDIILKDDELLKRFADYIEKINNHDIIGVAGAKAGVAGAITNIVHMAADGTLSPAGRNSVDDIVECDTLDECFFGGHTKCFIDYPFDEVLCDNWHMYAVERCLNAKANGNKVYVCDIPLIHASTGRINYAYNRNFCEISKKYSKKIKYIATTCARAKTDFFSRNLARIKGNFKIFLKG